MWTIQLKITVVTIAVIIAWNWTSMNESFGAHSNGPGSSLTATTHRLHRTTRRGFH